MSSSTWNNSLQRKRNNSCNKFNSRIVSQQSERSVWINVAGCEHKQYGASVVCERGLPVFYITKYFYELYLQYYVYIYHNHIIGWIGQWEP